MGGITDVKLTPLRIIDTEGGDVYHAIKSGDAGFCGFGEAYFSTVQQGFIKTWKRHRLMTLNLVVISGAIRFVVHDDRPGSPSFGCTEEYRIGPPEAYCRLTIPLGLWMAFQGVGPSISILLNVTDLAHDPLEADRVGLDKISYDWETQ